MGLPADIVRTGAHLRNQTDTASLCLRNKILLAIPETEVRLLHPLLQPFAFQQHTILHEPAQKLEFAYFPNRGLISLLVATIDGKTVEVGMVGNEGVAGVASAVGPTISPLREVAQISGDGFRIPVQSLQHLLEANPQLQMSPRRSA